MRTSQSPGQRLGSYRDAMTTTSSTGRKTPQRTVGVDDELWQAALRKAQKKRETLSAVIRRALVEYVEDDEDPDDKRQA